MHDLLYDIAKRTLITNQPQGLGLTLPEAHTRLLECYKQHTQNGLWHTLPDDSYIYTYLIWHLQQAGQKEQIHALFREETPERRNGWHQAREQLGQTAGFLADINLALKLAQQESNFGLQCRYLLIISSVNSLAGNLSATLMRALIEREIWDPIQCLTYASQIPSPTEKIDALRGLIPYCPESQKEGVGQKALEAAHKISDILPRMRAFVKITPLLVSPLKEYALKEAMVLAQVLSEERGGDSSLIQRLWSELIDTGQSRTQAVLRILQSQPYLRDLYIELSSFPIALSFSLDKYVGAEIDLSKLEMNRGESLGRRGFFREAPKRHIQYPYLRYDWLSSQELEGLLREDTVQKTVVDIHMITSMWARFQVLAQISPHLSPSLKERALQEALEVAQSFEDTCTRTMALAELADYLPESLLHNVVTTARTVKNDEIKIKILTKLVPYLSEPLKGKCLQEGLQSIQALTDDWDRACALIDLSPYLPEFLLWESLKTVETIVNFQIRTKVLLKITARLAELGCAQEVFDFGRSLKDAWIHTKILMGTLEYLPEILKDTTLQEILTTIQEIENAWGQAQELAALACYVPETLLMEALSVARTISNKRARGIALAGIVPHLPEVTRETVLQEILTTIRAFPDRESQSLVWTELSFQFSRSLSHFDIWCDLYQKAWDSVLETKEHRDEGDAWHHDNSIFDKMFLDQLLNVILSILQNCWQTASPEVLWNLLQQYIEQKVGTENFMPSAVAAQLVKIGMPETALKAVEVIEDERTQLNSLINIIPHLPSPLQDQTFHKALSIAQTITSPPNGIMTDLAKLGYYKAALQITQSIENIWSRMVALTAIAPFLPNSLKEEVLSAVLIEVQSTVPRWYLWDQDEILAASDILTAIVPVLPDPLKIDTLSTIFSGLRWLNDAHNRACVLEKIVPHLPKPLLEKAAKEISKITDQREWGKIIVKLAPRLIELDYPKKALILIQRIPDAEIWADALTGLIPLLPSLLRGEAIQSAMDKVQGFSSGEERIKACVKIVPCLAEWGYPKRALTLTHMIADAEIWADALTGLIPHLPNLVREEAIQSAMVYIPTISSVEKRIKVSALIVPFLPECLKGKMLWETIEVAQKLPEDCDRDAALQPLKNLLTSLAKWEYIEEELAIVELLDEELANVLIQLASYLPESLRKQAIREAITIVSSQDFFREHVPLVAEWISWLIQQGYPQEAVIVVNAITNVRMWKWVKQVPFLPDPLLRKVIREMMEEYETEAIWVKCVPTLPGPLLREVTIKAMENYGEDWPFGLEDTMVISYSPKTLLREVLEESLSINDGLERDNTLAEMIPLLAVFEEPEKAVSMAKSIEKTENLTRTMARILPYLTAPLLSRSINNSADNH